MREDARNRVPLAAVVVTNGFSLFHLSVPCMVLGLVLPEGKLFDVKLCSADSRKLLSPEGLALEAVAAPEMLPAADIVVIPYWSRPDHKPTPELLEALNQAYERGAQIVGLCLGTYVLAYAGLLEYKQASTHWAYEQDFIARFPHVDLNTNVLYVDDGRLITSAGTAAGLDCCLHIVRKYYGVVTANKVARTMVVSPHREGGQAQFIDRPLPLSSQDEKINMLMRRLGDALDQQHSLDALAACAMMSRRTLTRHFQKATGMSIGEWLAAARLQRAQELLEATSDTMDEIAGKTGFQSATSLRKQFRMRFGVSPREWRKTFQGI